MKKLILATFITLILSCKGQTEKNNDNSKPQTMEKFDANKYKNLPVNPETGLQIFPNGDEVQVFKGSGEKGFVEKISKARTPYVVSKSFYENGDLESVSTDFYSFVIGISKEYNEAGELIKETDHDKDYTFSIDDLQKKMKNDYSVNILDKKQTRSVGRVKTDKRINFAYYHVVVNSNIASFTEYLLNGTTGEVFYTIETTRGDEKDAVDEYVKTLKK